jgi:hypothetical protein
MSRSLARILLAASLVAFIAGAAVAQTEIEGQTAGGAFFRIAVPAGWEPADGLVIWNHGFSLSPPGPVSDLGPLVDIQLSEGYAVAASSYRQAGWALFKTNRDLEGLVDAFEAEFGVPDQVILTGASLGGAVTGYALEKAKLGNVTGAFMFCGAVAGSRNWDGAFDLRLMYDTICGNVPDAAIAGGATGLEKNSQMTPDAVAQAVNACTGVDLPKKKRSKQQKQNLAKLIELTNLPESFLQTDMGFATFGLTDLIFDKGKLKGKQGLGNANVDYGDDEIDAAIERVEAKKKPSRKLGKNYTPSGRVGDVKIVSMHTDKDGLVIVENQSEYASVVPAENLTVAVVAEAAPSHCGFSVAEVLSGWETFLQWIDGAPQPSAQDLQTNCQALEGLVGGPCRIDPGFVIPDMDGRVRPRG